MEFIFDPPPSSGNDSAALDASPITSSSVRRNLPSSVNDIEISTPLKKKSRVKTRSKVTYVKSSRKAKNKKSVKFEWTWNKAGWIFCGLLFMRLIFMEGGVIDFYGMESTIKNKVEHFSELELENDQLRTEISLIKTSPKYQKKLAREHLGVISHNEYLILFGKAKDVTSI